MMYSSSSQVTKRLVPRGGTERRGRGRREGGGRGRKWGDGRREVSQQTIMVMEDGRGEEGGGKQALLGEGEMGERRGEVARGEVYGA